MNEPLPIVATVCGTCREPWVDHEHTARRRAEREYQRALEDYVPGGLAPILPDEAQVTFQDCVIALQNKNRGPVGFTGPMGMQGPPGKDA